MSSIKINDFEIKLNTIYQVMPKYDGSAPDGWRKERTTKALAPWGKNIEAIPFHEGKKVWDTGLYKDSPIFTHKKEEEVNEIVAFVQEHIVEKLEKSFYEKGTLDHKDKKESYWDNYGIELYNGRIFNTDDPKQLLDLYLSVLHGKICPKGKAESSPYFPFAQFTVENKERSKTVRQENELITTKAIGLFYSLLNSNKEKLRLVMNYVGVKVPEKASDGIFTTSFTSYIEHKDDSRLNKERFIEAVEMSNDPDKYQELYFYKVIQDLFRKKVITKEREYVVFEGTKLGTSYKEAAKKIASDKNLIVEINKKIEA